MQSPLYQTPATVFRNNCCFNNLFCCRAPTSIQKHSHSMTRDIQFRNFIRGIVDPPPNTTWAAEPYDISNNWNLRDGHWPRACRVFFSSRSFLAARKCKGTELFYWAASRHRLFLYWPISRCANSPARK